MSVMTWNIFEVIAEFSQHFDMKGWKNEKLNNKNMLYWPTDSQFGNGY
jgi:hypothetical protein